MSLPMSFVTITFSLFSLGAASALPWPTEQQFSERSSALAPRSTTSTTKTGIPAWQIAVISLGIFFGVMALGMIGGALEVLLHTRKKVADPDQEPSDLDFGSRGVDAEDIKEGEEQDDASDGDATAVEESTDGVDEKGKHGARYSWQDSQGVQMEVWNDQEGDSDASHDRELAEDNSTPDHLPQHPEPAYAGAQYGSDHEDEQYYPQYHHEEMSGYAEGHDGQSGNPEGAEYHQEQQDGTGDAHYGYGHEGAEEAHDEVQDFNGQRMTRYEPWIPHMEEDKFHEVPLPEHGSQSETTHQQHPVEYI